VPSAKRERQKQGRALRQQEMLEARRRAGRRRQLITFVVVGVLGVLVLVYCGAFSGSSDNNGDSSVKAAACPSLKDQARKTSFSAPPATCIDAKKAYTAVLESDVGTFKIELDNKRAPKTVNNFVVLARYHYYDGLSFHRVIKEFVVQGGDPKGTGAGGPGYTFPDEALAGSTYVTGTVAMANSGPNTNGSQFYIVLSDGNGLQPLYSVFGKVVEGMDNVKKIEADGAEKGTDVPPTVVHKIIKVTIEERARAK
jgi:cyclophilin family peptidyl-prolyl cis-trans isomerase